MCGIFGYIGPRPAWRILLAGLKRLEYRGYDSAGIAVIEEENGVSALVRRRAKGKIVNLEQRVKLEPVDGVLGIAHTRWATHGAVTETNAHPHFAGRVGIVHNGIIENFTELREMLQDTRTFNTQTDTEVVAHMIDEAMRAGLSGQDAFTSTLKQLRGAFAIGVVIDGVEGQMFAARKGPPLAIGIGDGENYIGSDAIALSTLSKKIIYLEEGDWAVLTADSVQVYDANDNAVTREVTHITGSMAAAEKGNYRHFMLKEIYEQPETTAHTLTHYIDAFNHKVKTEEELKLKGLDFAKVERLSLIACGTAAYAACVAKYWFEQLAGLPTDVDVASEFRYRRPALTGNTLAMAVSQSGETADTLAALRYCGEQGLKTAVLVNVLGSTMAREADYALPINAGPEIGVASTKAFTSQLTALLCMAITAGVQRGFIDSEREKSLVENLTHIPRLINETLALDGDIEVLAQKLSSAKSAFYLGRGVHFPLALEGALKLKEISYIHAEGYAAGELKHGPIALIEDGTPVIVIAPSDELFEKTISNLQEVATRGANVLLITDAKGAKHARDMAPNIITCPDVSHVTAPIIYAITIQLLAYHTAVHLGTDVDQPRNLAKSVTVE